ncbi:MAG: HNH endonuclease [Oscillospiraceae bacterium]|nr:HNH endonuclease [Oscillospiraceae bacterium]
MIKNELKKFGLDGIKYHDGIPDFSKIAAETVEIDRMTDNRASNFQQCDEKCAEKWNKSKKDGRTDWTPEQVRNWRKEHGYSWHENNDRKTCELVPTKIHNYFTHLGGVSECRKSNGKKGTEFDDK